MKIRTNLALVVVNMLVLLTFLSLTNPDNLPIVLLMVPMLLIFSLGSLVTGLGLRVFHFFDNKPRKRSLVAVAGGSFGALFVVAQSTGGITVGDLILLSLIGIISLFYIAKY